MNGNTTTKKSFTKLQGHPVGHTSPQKLANTANNSAGMDEGQMRGNAQTDKFGAVMNPGGLTAAISGMDRTYNDIGEMSGFITGGYLDKQHTPYGEAAKFNYMPPGMDISNQCNAEIHAMPMRVLVAESYPGDGWSPAPKDLTE
jgi:hypothetical protein